jgi:hypothetical protein
MKSETLLHFAAGLGAAFFGAVAMLASTSTVVTSATSPQGVMLAELEGGWQGAAFPLFPQEVIVARVASRDGVIVRLAAVAPDWKALLDPAGAYYLEVLNGPWEGERIDVRVAPTLASAGPDELIISPGLPSASTRAFWPAGTLQDVQVAIRRHTQLRDLGAALSPGLRGHDDPNLADLVQVWQRGTWRSYHLRGDGLTWVQVGRSWVENGLVIPPDESVLLSLRSGPQRWIHLGNVRTNSFRKNLRPGWQSFAFGFPSDLSPLQIGAWVDATVPVSRRWKGSDQPAAADRLQVWDNTLDQFRTFFLGSDGRSWFEVGGSGADLAAAPILPATGLILLWRTMADPEFLVLPPMWEEIGGDLE